MSGHVRPPDNVLTGAFLGGLHALPHLQGRLDRIVSQHVRESFATASVRPPENVPIGPFLGGFHVLPHSQSQPDRLI